MKRQRTGMVMAQLDTGRYKFHAFGVDEASALQALRDAWVVHVEHTDADPDYLDEVVDDVNYAEVGVGVVLRDGTPIIGG